MLNPFNYPICFATPKRLVPSAWHEHVPFAMFLVDILRPEIVVELGTHQGVSYCALCQAVKELCIDSRCYAIDTWQGDPHSGFYGPEVLADLRGHHDVYYGDFSRLIQSTFEEALEHFADGTISLLHIDAYHTYEAVKRDFEAWLPKMSASGVILLHDTNVLERDFGVNKFWTEIKSQYQHFEFLHGNGLGVLAVGEVTSDEFQALLCATGEEATIIRDFFFQLGNRLYLKFENEDKARVLAEQADHISTQLDVLNHLEGELERHKQIVVEKEQALHSLLTQLAESEQAVQSLSAEAEQKEQATRQLSKQLLRQGQAIHYLSMQVEERDQTLQSLIAQFPEKKRVAVSPADKQKKANQSKRLKPIRSPISWFRRR